MLSVKEKIESIIELTEKHHISAYEIGKNTPISKSSAQKIISRTQNNPKHKTLNLILEYIEKTIVGTTGSVEPANYAAESSADYNNFNALSLEDKLTAIFNQNTEILSNQKVIKTKISDINLSISILANIISVDTETKTKTTTK